MGEWDPKPDCFGELKKENMPACKDCEHMNACLGVTYISAMKDAMEKQNPTNQPTANLVPSGVYKGPTAEQTARTCKRAFDEFIKVGFDKAEALNLTLRFADMVQLEELKDK